MGGICSRALADDPSACGLYELTPDETDPDVTETELVGLAERCARQGSRRILTFDGVREAQGVLVVTFA